MAGLDGTFRAWLSNSTQSPAADFARSTGDYVRVDDSVVAAGFEDLLDGMVDAQINLFANGEMVNDQGLVWTGTTILGGPTGSDCQDWSTSAASFDGTMGRADTLSAFWTEATPDDPCSQNGRFYCVQQ
jgi:hypothetical protein